MHKKNDDEKVTWVDDKEPGWFMAQAWSVDDSDLEDLWCVVYIDDTFRAAMAELKALQQKTVECLWAQCVSNPEMWRPSQRNHLNVVCSVPLALTAVLDLSHRMHESAFAEYVNERSDFGDADQWCRIPLTPVEAMIALGEVEPPSRALHRMAANNNGIIEPVSCLQVSGLGNQEVRIVTKGKMHDVGNVKYVSKLF